MTFSQTERATLMAIANRIESQADSLESTVQKTGILDLESVFRNDVWTLRGLARELQEVIGGNA